MCSHHFRRLGHGFQPAVQAKSAGVTRETFDRAFQGFTPDPEVIEAANFQPEYVKPVGEYIDRAVSEKRIQIGKQKLVEYQALLGALENRYGVKVNEKALAKLVGTNEEP